MKLCEVPFILLLVAISQVSAKYCVPRSTRAYLKSHINNLNPPRKNSLGNVILPATADQDNYILIKDGNTRNNRNILEKKKYKMSNIPDIEYPTYNTYKNPFQSKTILNSNIFGMNEDLTSDIGIKKKINDFKKQKRMDRKLKKLKNEASYNTKKEMPSLSNYMASFEPFWLEDSQTFPEVQYPLNAMETWTPSYWNPPLFPQNKIFDATMSTTYDTQRKFKRNNVSPMPLLKFTMTNKEMQLDARDFVSTQGQNNGENKIKSDLITGNASFIPISEPQNNAKQVTYSDDKENSNTHNIVLVDENTFSDLYTDISTSTNNKPVTKIMGLDSPLLKSKQISYKDMEQINICPFYESNRNIKITDVIKPSNDMNMENEMNVNNETTTHVCEETDIGPWHVKIPIPMPDMDKDLTRNDVINETDNGASNISIVVVPVDNFVHSEQLSTNKHSTDSLLLIVPKTKPTPIIMHQISPKFPWLGYISKSESNIKAEFPTNEQTSSNFRTQCNTQSNNNASNLNNTPVFSNLLPIIITKLLETFPNMSKNVPLVEDSLNNSELKALQPTRNDDSTLETLHTRNESLQDVIKDTNSLCKYEETNELLNKSNDTNDTRTSVLLTKRSNITIPNAIIKDTLKLFLKKFPDTFHNSVDKTLIQNGTEYARLNHKIQESGERATIKANKTEEQEVKKSDIDLMTDEVSKQVASANPNSLMFEYVYSNNRLEEVTKNDDVHKISARLNTNNDKLYDDVIRDALQLFLKKFSGRYVDAPEKSNITSSINDIELAGLSEDNFLINVIKDSLQLLLNKYPYKFLNLVDNSDLVLSQTKHGNVEKRNSSLLLNKEMSENCDNVIRDAVQLFLKKFPEKYFDATEESISLSSRNDIELESLSDDNLLINVIKDSLQLLLNKYPYKFLNLVDNSDFLLSRNEHGNAEKRNSPLLVNKKISEKSDNIIRDAVQLFLKKFPGNLVDATEKCNFASSINDIERASLSEDNLLVNVIKDSLQLLLNKYPNKFLNLVDNSDMVLSRIEHGNAEKRNPPLMVNKEISKNSDNVIRDTLQLFLKKFPGKYVDGNEKRNSVSSRNDIELGSLSEDIFLVNVIKDSLQMLLNKHPNKFLNLVNNSDTVSSRFEHGNAEKGNAPLLVNKKIDICGTGKSKDLVSRADPKNIQCDMSAGVMRGDNLQQIYSSKNMHDVKLSADAINAAMQLFLKKLPEKSVSSIDKTASDLLINKKQLGNVVEDNLLITIIEDSLQLLLNKHSNKCFNVAYKRDSTLSQNCTGNTTINNKTKEIVSARERASLQKNKKAEHTLGFDTAKDLACNENFSDLPIADINSSPEDKPNKQLQQFSIPVKNTYHKKISDDVISTALLLFLKKFPGQFDNVLQIFETETLDLIKNVLLNEELQKMSSSAVDECSPQHNLEHMHQEYPFNNSSKSDNVIQTSTPLDNLNTVSVKINKDASTLILNKLSVTNISRNSKDSKDLPRRADTQNQNVMKDNPFFHKIEDETRPANEAFQDIKPNVIENKPVVLGSSHVTNLSGQIIHDPERHFKSKCIPDTLPTDIKADHLSIFLNTSPDNSISIIEKRDSAIPMSTTENREKTNSIGDNNQAYQLVINCQVRKVPVNDQTILSQKIDVNQNQISLAEKTIRQHYPEYILKKINNNNTKLTSLDSENPSAFDIICDTPKSIVISENSIDPKPSSIMKFLVNLPETALQSAQEKFLEDSFITILEKNERSLSNNKDNRNILAENSKDNFIVQPTNIIDINKIALLNNDFCEKRSIPSEINPQLTLELIYSDNALIDALAPVHELNTSSGDKSNTIIKDVDLLSLVFPVVMERSEKEMALETCYNNKTNENKTHIETDQFDGQLAKSPEETITKRRVKELVSEPFYNYHNNNLSTETNTSIDTNPFYKQLITLPEGVITKRPDKKVVLETYYNNYSNNLGTETNTSITTNQSDEQLATPPEKVIGELPGMEVLLKTCYSHYNHNLSTENNTSNNPFDEQLATSPEAVITEQPIKGVVIETCYNYYNNSLSTENNTSKDQFDEQLVTSAEDVIAEQPIKEVVLETCYNCVNNNLRIENNTSKDQFDKQLATSAEAVIAEQPIREVILETCYNYYNNNLSTENNKSKEQLDEQLATSPEKVIGEQPIKEMALETCYNRYNNNLSTENNISKEHIDEQLTTSPEEVITKQTIKEVVIETCYDYYNNNLNTENNAPKHQFDEQLATSPEETITEQPIKGEVLEICNNYYNYNLRTENNTSKDQFDEQWAKSSEDLIAKQPIKEVVVETFYNYYNNNLSTENNTSKYQFDEQLASSPEEVIAEQPVKEAVLETCYNCYNNNLSTENNISKEQFDEQLTTSPEEVITEQPIKEVFIETCYNYYNNNMNTENDTSKYQFDEELATSPEETITEQPIKEVVLETCYNYYNNNLSTENNTSKDQFDGQLATSPEEVITKRPTKKIVLETWYKYYNNNLGTEVNTSIDTNHFDEQLADSCEITQIPDTNITDHNDHYNTPMGIENIGVKSDKSISQNNSLEISINYMNNLSISEDDVALSNNKITDINSNELNNVDSLNNLLNVNKSSSKPQMNNIVPKPSNRTDFKDLSPIESLHGGSLNNDKKKCLNDKTSKNDAAVNSGVTISTIQNNSALVKRKQFSKPKGVKILYVSL